jgi:uncharacterized protein
VPFQIDGQYMPGLKLITKPGATACRFLTPEGCGVYEDRPTACRYSALGSMGLHKKDSATVEDIYFLVKEEHCLGYNEPRTITIRDYRKEQGVDKVRRYESRVARLGIEETLGWPDRACAVTTQHAAVRQVQL